MVWKRTVNVHGRPGKKNIPCDLYMEHLIRECKDTIGSLGPNVSSVNVVAWVGKSVGELMTITTQYDSISELNPESGKHLKRSIALDLMTIIEQLKEPSIFQLQSGRKHNHFPKFLV